MRIFNIRTAELCKAFPSSGSLCLEKAGALPLAAEGCYFSKLRLESVSVFLPAPQWRRWTLFLSNEVAVLTGGFIEEILPIFTGKKNLLGFFFKMLSMTLAKGKVHLHSLFWITAFFS